MESAAQIWRKAAIDAFNEKNYPRAAECYHKAAKEYKEGYINAKTTQEKEFYKTEHNFCAERYDECKNPKVVVARPQRAAMVSQNGGSLEDAVDEDEVHMNIEKQKTRYTFNDVGGMDKLKKTLYNNVIETYAKPHELDELRETSSQNYLLYGRPGCGKTYILEALVGELNKRLRENGKKEVTFIAVTLSTLKSKYVGETERRMHAYFKEAAKNTPCALLIDEIDSVGSKRTDNDIPHNDALNALLKEIDSISDKDIILLGATNRPEILDDALTRPGRFGDHQIEIPMPDYEARKNIFRIKCRKMKNRGKLASDVDFDKLAEITDGYSAADIGAICGADVIDVAKERSKTDGKMIMFQQDFVTSIGNIKESKKEKVRCIR